MFNTTDEVYEWLFNERKLARREDLSRIKKCIELLNIKTDYKIIHITGTNGKGSVAADIKSILSLTGLHIGFFVSPFVISFNERIQINDRYISNAEIMHYANILYTFSKEYKEKYKDVVPFFELTLLMALLYFQDRAIDLAIIECGLGGLLDATNFLNADLSIITNVGYDHMAQLGNTLEEIANHKLGILKENGHLITAVDDALKNQFNGYAKKINATIQYIQNEDISSFSLGIPTSFIYKGNSYQTNLFGRFQITNACIAIEAVNYLFKDFPMDLISYGLANVKWPGRMEILSKEPFILLDGGHNYSAIAATTETIKELKEKKKVKVLFNSLGDKDYKAMIEKLDEIAEEYYFTKLDDLRAIDPNTFKEYTQKKTTVILNIEDCLRTALQDLAKDEILFITGSLHFISIIRNIFKNILMKNLDINLEKEE